MAIDTSDLSAAKDVIDAFNQALSQGPEQVEKLASSIASKIGNNAKKNLEDLKERLDDVFDSFKDNIKAIDDLANSSVVLQKDGAIGEGVDNLIDKFGTLAEFINNGKFFDKFASDSMSSLNLISGNADKLLETMKKFHLPGTDNLKGITEAVIQNASQSEKLEGSYISLAAASGDLNSIFEENSTKLKDLTGLTTSYMRTVLDSAKITGLSAEQATQFSNALKQIPGALNESIRSGEGSNESMNSSVAIMRLMTGTGKSQADVINSLKMSYENLSQAQGKITDSGQKGAEFFATISNVANTLKIRFEDVQPVMNTIADNFKNIGNETDDAAKVLARYTEALRETGLTSKASLGITQDLIKNMSSLTTGTKAFLSLRSGGPGGLQGSFQIDELLRNGKLDQVVQMAERSLKQQFGGKIYSQAEAAQSPEAASQFMRQRQLLQSGAFGIGKGTDDASATRLLESLGKGDVGGASKEIKTGQSALLDATEKGTQIHQRNNNELKKMALSLDTISIYTEIRAGETLRNALGTGREDSASNKDLRAGMKDQSNSLSRTNTTQRIGYEQSGITAQEKAKELIMLARSSVKGILGSGGAIGQDAGDATKKAFSALQDEVQGPKTPARSSAIYNNGVTAATSNAARRPATSNVIAASAAAAKEKQPTQSALSSNKDKSQKILLEITAPPGLDFKTKSPSEDVIVTFNKGNANPTGHM